MLDSGLVSFYIRGTNPPDDQPTLPLIISLTKPYSTISGASRWLSRISYYSSANRREGCGVAIESLVVIDNHLIIEGCHSGVAIQ